MEDTTSKYTVQKVEVYRVFDEHGVEVVQYDDEYGHPYPLDFASEDAARGYVLRKDSPGLHGPLTKEETERQEAIWKMYGPPLLAILKAPTPFTLGFGTQPLPLNSGKTIQFFS